jgi:hypothetical protein
MLTPQNILDKGFTGKKVGEILKESKTWNAAQVDTFLKHGIIPKKEFERAEKGSILDWICNSEIFSTMCSIEGSHSVASNSERRRWVEKGSLKINGIKVGINDFVPMKIDSLVFFEGSHHQITMV